MKVFCDGLDLSSAVLKVVKATSTKNFNPILEGIKIVAQDEILILTATDGDLAIEKRIKADVKVDGETVVPGKFFSEYVKKLTNGSIELELNEKNQLKIKYTDSETYIQCLNPQEYPHIKTVNNTEYVSIKSKNFKSVIEKTIFAVATDDTRPILKGASFETEDNDLCVVALDGYRLAKNITQIEGYTSKFKCVFPGRSLKEISNLLDDSEDIINIYFDRNYTMVEIDDTKIISRLLDGEFINYKQILPKNFCSKMLINKAQLENSLEQGAILARQTNDNKVQFHIQEKLINLKTNNELGNWSDNVAITLTGDDIDINFNLNYIRDCLKVIDDDFVEFSFSGKYSPCIVQGENDTKDNSLYLILPLRQI